MARSNKEPVRQAVKVFYRPFVDFFCRGKLGCFAFSAELPPPQTGAGPPRGGMGYALAPTGRFWHEASYLRGLAEAVGFELVSLTARALRRNAGKDVPGSVVVLRRRRHCLQ